MKIRRGAAAAMVAGAAAQTTTSPAGYVSSPASMSSMSMSMMPPSSMPVSYTTLTVDDCPSAYMETMITVTQGKTITYCPECPPEQTAAPTNTKPPGHTTVYTTVYQSLCSTGTVPVTYTVTESCDEPEPTWTQGPDHVPNGFTVTVKECTACGKKPMPVTITEPCDCEATSGTWVGPAPTSKPTPIQQIPDGQVQNPAPGWSASNDSPAPTGSSTPCNGEHCGGSGSGSNPSKPSSGGSNPAAPAESCTGGKCGGSGSGNVPPPPSGGMSGSTPPYPTTTAEPQCPGPECRAKATGDMPMSSTAPMPPSGSTENIPPYEGLASTSRAGFFVSFALTILVGGLAFAL